MNGLFKIIFCLTTTISCAKLSIVPESRRIQKERYTRAMNTLEKDLYPKCSETVIDYRHGIHFFSAIPCEQFIYFIPTLNTGSNYLLRDEHYILRRLTDYE